MILYSLVVLYYYYFFFLFIPYYDRIHVQSNSNNNENAITMELSILFVGKIFFLFSFFCVRNVCCSTYIFSLIQYFLEHGIRNEQHQQFVEVNKKQQNKNKKRHNEPLFCFVFLGMFCEPLPKIKL